MRAGAGYDTIDFNYCSTKGIYVANCPGKNANAVSELAMGLILCIDRRIAEGVNMLKAGNWNKGMFANCRGIRGKTIGLIGFGNIGKNVCRAAKAFDMNVLVCTRTQPGPGACASSSARDAASPSSSFSEEKPSSSDETEEGES